MSIRVIIKGELADARQAAADRNITIFHERINRGGNRCEIIADAPNDDYTKLVAWFRETLGPAPFPAGTLLWHSAAAR